MNLSYLIETPSHGSGISNKVRVTWVSQTSMLQDITIKTEGYETLTLGADHFKFVTQKGRESGNLNHIVRLNPQVQPSSRN
jgi:hypothetical protein